MENKLSAQKMIENKIGVNRIEYGHKLDIWQCATLMEQYANQQLRNENEEFKKTIDNWILDCQSQADYYLKRGSTYSEGIHLAMKVAYMNIRTLLTDNQK